MTIELILFYALALLTIVSTITVALANNILYAALSLLCTFVGVAGLYIYASADYLAVTQIMVYVGGVLVLLIFGIMLTNKIGIKYLPNPSANRLNGFLLSFSVFIIISLGIVKTNFDKIPWLQANTQTAGKTTDHIGFNLLTNYVFPFELASVLLLVALIGAAFVASKQNNLWK